MEDGEREGSDSDMLTAQASLKTRVQSLALMFKKQNPSMALHAHNPSAVRAESGRSLSSPQYYSAGEKKKKKEQVTG